MKRRRGIFTKTCLSIALGIAALSVLPSTSAHGKSILNTGISAGPEDVRALYDNANATAFLTEDNGLLIFEIPFPAKAAQFKLELVEISTGNILLESVYKMTEEGIKPLIEQGIETNDQNSIVFEGRRQFEIQSNTQLLSLIHISEPTRPY